MKMHRLLRRGRSIFVICLIGTCVSHALAQNHTPNTSQLGGFAYIDRNKDGILAFVTDPKPELIIPGVEIQLFKDGSLLHTDFTDESGRYFFENLTAGLYTIRQIQPVKYIDGQSTLGTFESLTTDPVPGTGFLGIAGVNEFTGINLPANVRGDFYNFGELGLAPGYASKRFLLTTTALTSATSFASRPPAIVPDDSSLIPEPSSGLTGFMALVWGVLLSRRKRRRGLASKVET